MKAKYILRSSVILTFISFVACSNTTDKKPEISQMNMNTSPGSTNDTIYLAGGCFWCTEAIFQQLNGVLSVRSGYIGGKIKNPTYREVSSGLTGHAEAIELTYDPKIVNLYTLLEVFFKTHDPTTLNRQGADAGTQYRSGIFYTNPEQKNISEEVIRGLTASGAFDDPIVTEVKAADTFYAAEDYHQNYFNENKNTNPYCQYVIVPKLEKLQQYFKDKMKK